MMDHGYRVPSHAERLMYGSLVQRETVPSIFAGWIKRSLHSASVPHSTTGVPLIPRLGQIGQITIIPEREPQKLIEDFAGDPTVRFDVRSIDVDGYEIGSLRYFGVPDLMDNLLFEGSSEVYGLALLK